MLLTCLSSHRERERLAITHHSNGISDTTFLLVLNTHARSLFLSPRTVTETNSHAVRMWCSQNASSNFPKRRAVNKHTHARTHENFLYLPLAPTSHTQNDITQAQSIKRHTNTHKQTRTRLHGVIRENEIPDIQHMFRDKGRRERERERERGRRKQSGPETAARGRGRAKDNAVCDLTRHTHTRTHPSARCSR